MPVSHVLHCNKETLQCALQVRPTNGWPGVRLMLSGALPLIYNAWKMATVSQATTSRCRRTPFLEFVIPVCPASLVIVFNLVQSCCTNVLPGNQYRVSSLYIEQCNLCVHIS